ncbi:hypothetical protein [Calidifontibacter terrae]
MTMARDYGAPTQPGWRTVAGKTTAMAAYDLPPTTPYKFLGVNTDVGYDSPEGVDRPSIIATAPSTYGARFCATEKAADKAFFGFVNIGTREPAEAAPSVADALDRPRTGRPRRPDAGSRHDEDHCLVAAEGELISRVWVTWRGD